MSCISNDYRNISTSSSFHVFQSLFFKSWYLDSFLLSDAFIYMKNAFWCIQSKIVGLWDFTNILQFCFLCPKALLTYLSLNCGYIDIMLNNLNTHIINRQRDVTFSACSGLLTSCLSCSMSWPSSMAPVSWFRNPCSLCISPALPSGSWPTNLCLSVERKQSSVYSVPRICLQVRCNRASIIKQYNSSFFGAES